MTSRMDRYRLKECPFCHRFFRNVKNHIYLAHQVNDEPAGLTREDLLGIPRQAPEAEPEYVCTACGADVRRGERVCSACGAELLWERL